MRILVALAMVTITALAGCAKPADDAGQVVCPSTTTGPPMSGATTEPIPSGCPAPKLPPRVLLAGVPAMITAFQYQVISATPENRSFTTAHAMDTQIRISTTSVPDSALAEPDTFGTLVKDARMQHQALPKTLHALLRVNEPGVYYVRAYALIGATHVWSPEVQLMVHPVVATGTVHTLTHSVGGPVSTFESNGSADIVAALGDSFQIKNDDLIERTFRISAPISMDVTVDGQGGLSDVFLLFMPNSYTITSDDLPNSKVIDITVPELDKPALPS